MALSFSRRFSVLCLVGLTMLAAGVRAQESRPKVPDVEKREAAQDTTPHRG